MNRLEMIKNAAYKIQGNPEFKASMKKANQRFIKDCQAKIARLEAKKLREEQKELDKMDENYNLFDIKTAKAIAETEVGETFRETTKFDNEWN